MHQPCRQHASIDNFYFEGTTVCATTLIFTTTWRVVGGVFAEKCKSPMKTVAICWRPKQSQGVQQPLWDRFHLVTGWNLLPISQECTFFLFCKFLWYHISKHMIISVLTYCLAVRRLPGHIQPFESRQRKVSSYGFKTGLQKSAGWRHSNYVYSL